MARAVDAVKLLVLGGAGIGAFYAAAHLSRPQAPQDAEAVVVAPARPGGTASQAGVPGGGPPRMATASLPSPAMAADPARSAASPSTDARGDRSSAIPGATGQPFAALSWVAPPPPPRPAAVAPVAVAAPTAPPLPFAFVGMVEKGTPRPQAFLSKGDALLVVSPGDTIDDGIYRVDAVDPAQIVLTHLPTNTKQAINLAGASQ